MRGSEAEPITGERGAFTPAEVEAFYVEWDEKYGDLDAACSQYETFCADVAIDPNDPESWARWCGVSETRNA